MALTSSARRPMACLACQWRRAFATTRVRLADEKTPGATALPPATAAESEKPVIEAPRSYGRRLENFTPKPLPRPIGLQEPPQAGDNTGVDRRSLRERRADFVDYDKHLKRRQELKEQFMRPYFRDWNNLQFHDGKSFIAPPRLFRADKALYFPNFFGRTLLKDGQSRDTTPLLEGKASVVAIFSSQWAENQVASFISKEANPVLHQILQGSRGKAQLVQVNVEENSFKAWLIRLFIGGLRRRIGQANWDKYFIVRKGITTDIRESIGLLNSKVGYTYLVDHKCRVRWAGSGASEEAERESLDKGVQRILKEISEEDAAARLAPRARG